MQKVFDKQIGFSHFPYTHGEELEKARAEHRQAVRAEAIATQQLKEGISRAESHLNS